MLVLPLFTFHILIKYTSLPNIYMWQNWICFICVRKWLVYTYFDVSFKTKRSHKLEPSINLDYLLFISVKTSTVSIFSIPLSLSLNFYSLRQDIVFIVLLHCFIWNIRNWQHWHCAVQCQVSLLIELLFMFCLSRLRVYVNICAVTIIGILEKFVIGGITRKMIKLTKLRSARICVKGIREGLVNLIRFQIVFVKCL